MRGCHRPGTKFNCFVTTGSNYSMSHSTPYCQHTTFPRGGRHPLSVIFLWAEWRYFDFELHPSFNSAGRAASNLDMQTMIENTIKNTMIENTMNTLDNKTQVMSDATIDFTPVRF